MRNYVVAHWRGQLGLAASCLINGIGIYALLITGGFALGLAYQAVFGPRALDDLAGSPPLVFALLAGFLSWLVWALVGIVRSGARHLADRDKAPLHRVAGALAILLAAVVAVVTVNDLYHTVRGRGVDDGAQIKAASRRP